MKFLKLVSLASLIAFCSTAVLADVSIRSVTDQTATITQDGQVSSLSGGELLSSGLLQTNSSTVVVVLQNGSVLSFGPNSAVQVGSLSGASPRIELISGSVSGSAVGNVVVVTGAGEASATNGAFSVTTDGATIQASNANATVSVTPAGASAVNVPAGQSTTANQSGVVSVTGLSATQIASIINSGSTPVVSSSIIQLPPAFENTLIELEVASDPLPGGQ